jgi:DNA-binding SARP family transcriptional activator/tetratricopeptide (TPR) repeat protein
LAKPLAEDLAADRRTPIGARRYSAFVQFRMLGPVEIESDDGRVHTLTRRQERSVLAVLLLNPGRIVSVDRLCELLWDDNPPDEPRQALHSHVSRIRGLLKRVRASDHGVALTSHRGGYQLTVDPDLIDAHRFRRLVTTAKEADGLTERDQLLREALALWRGRAVHHATATDRLRDRLCADLDELHLQAQEESLATGIDLGRHHQLLPELAHVCAEHPTRQRLTELHMLALYRDGRTEEALDVYRHTRERLADELGLDPNSTLQHLHTTILRGESIRATTGSSVAPGSIAPAQLPADLRGFIGRVEHLGELDALLPDAHSAPGATAVVISAIEGTAGVGKTALAVHWAHRVRDRFPDGQLYVNLRGFDPSGQIMDPATAVRGFLDALQLPPQRIPADLDAQAALYRSLLTGRRMLIVLDNARDTAQVRPLLPGAPGCLVVVTSRNQLTSLIAANAAHPVTLDLLTPDEAQQLLARRLGTDRIAAEPDAVQEIITRCARLPLALTLVAAHAAIRPHTGLRSLADELRDTQHRWQTLTGDDPTTDVRTLFSWSYHTLTPDAARMFRLLGLHPGPDITAPAAASLTALTPTQAQPLLAELTRANLLTEPSPGRYTFHDLLRTYAAEQAQTVDPATDRHAALHRILDHYLHTAHAAALLLSPQRDPLALPPLRPGAVPVALDNRDQALVWLTAEHQVLLAAIDQAAGTGFERHAWQLAWSLTDYLYRRTRWRDWAASHEIALDAARRLGDRDGQARIRRGLAGAKARLGRFTEAHAHLRSALDGYAEIGDRIGQANIHLNVVRLLERQGRHHDALSHAQQALDLFQAAGHRVGMARALSAVGWCHTLIGNHQHAIDNCQQAIVLHQESGDRDGEAHTWDTLGHAHHHLRDHARAIACYERALDMLRDLGGSYFEADTLSHLGDAHHAAGDPNAARAALRHALDILDQLEHPDAANVSAKLHELDRTSARHATSPPAEET